MKFLGKKKRVFLIEKDTEKFEKKKRKAKKVSIFLSPKKKGVNQKSELNSDLDDINKVTINESQLSPYPRNGLIAISSEVLKFMKENQRAKASEVTDHIISDLHLNGIGKINFKNIQRRVYDAINVMCALDIIKKDKREQKELKFVSSHYKEEETLSNSNDDKVNKSSLSTKTNINNNESNKSDHEIQQKMIILREQQRKLSRLYIDTVFYKLLNKINTMNPSRSTEEKLGFPLDLIKIGQNESVRFLETENGERFIFSKNSNFDIIRSKTIIKKLIMKYLNEQKQNNNCNNNNLQTNKETHKKEDEKEKITDKNDNTKNVNKANSFNIKRITKENEEEKIIDEKKQKFNLNQSIQEIKKSESLKKNEQLIMSVFITDESNEQNKFLEKIFNYLKDKHVFKEELMGENDEFSHEFSEESRDSKDYNSLSTSTNNFQ